MALKQRDFLLGIITDTIYPLEWKMSWLEQVGVAELIDVVVCSSTADQYAETLPDLLNVPIFQTC